MLVEDKLIQRPGIHLLNRPVYLQFLLSLRLQNLYLLRRDCRDYLAFFIALRGPEIAHVQNDAVVDGIRDEEWPLAQ